MESTSHVPAKRVNFVWLSSMCHPCRGFLFAESFPHRSPFTSFRASAVGYVVTSLRDSQQHTAQIPRTIVGPGLLCHQKWSTANG